MTQIARLPDRGVIESAGEDRVAFLQGLVSNDVSAGRARARGMGRAADPAGQVAWPISSFSTDGTRLLLDCRAGAAADAAAAASAATGCARK